MAGSRYKRIRNQGFFLKKEAKTFAPLTYALPQSVRPFGKAFASFFKKKPCFPRVALRASRLPANLDKNPESVAF
jgi:hypothetical protein